MTPKQLGYFTRIAECGSFAAAARALHIAQPALSQQIAKLEVELGLKLFHRKPRGVELTEGGQSLLGRAYKILRQIESTVLEVQSAAVEAQGVVRVGMVPTVNNILAPLLAKTVAQRLPKVELEIIAGASEYLNRQLQEQRIDLCIVHPDKSGFEQFTVTPLLREQLYFVASTSNHYPHIHECETGATIGFADQAHYRLLSTEIYDGLGVRLLEYEQKTGISLNKQRSYGQLLTDLNEILAGRAQMILPRSAVDHLYLGSVPDSRLKFAKVVDPEMVRDVFLLSSPRAPLSNGLLKTQSLIHRLVQQLLAEGRTHGSYLGPPS